MEWGVGGISKGCSGARPRGGRGVAFPGPEGGGGAMGMGAEGDARLMR